MALLLSPMSAIPHIQHHMTSARGHSVPSNLSHNPANVVTQSDNKRPKLSLQTTSLSSTYGSLTRGLAPNTTQAIYTPTTANTLSNTWDLSIRPSPISRTESPRPISQTRLQAGQQPYAYSLPFGIRPILKNSPLAPRAASVSASPRESRRKVFFPQPKRVSFKQDLEEPIETKQYTAKHSDLTSSEEETSEDEPQKESTNPPNTDSTLSAYHASPPPNRKRKVRRDSGISIESKTEAVTSETPAAQDVDADDDGVTVTKTPLTRKRRKRQSSSSHFGGSIEKEGIALRRSSETSTSLDDPKSSRSPDTTSGSGHSSSSEDQVEKEDYEVAAALGEPTLKGRRISSTSPPEASTRVPNQDDYGNPSKTPSGRRPSASRHEDGDDGDGQI